MDQLATQIRVERHVAANDELGIPRFRITNGPVGVGMGDGTPSPPATSLPMTIGVAAAFDPELAHEYGDIIGSETATLGQHVLEGPGVCLHRSSIAGRNFEYFSEDPYLSGLMGVEVTKAIQAHDVIAMAKHYVVNDQEFERFRTSVEVDEHVLRELYLLPFEMVVKDARHRRGHERLQPRARGVCHRAPLHPYRHPAHGVGLRRLRALGLLVLPLRGGFPQRRHGPRDAGREVAQRRERQERPPRHEPRDPDGGSRARAALHADVPVRPIRASLRPRRDRRRRPRCHLPPHRLPDGRAAEERRRHAAPRPDDSGLRGDHRPAGLRRRRLPGRRRLLQGDPAVHRQARRGYAGGAGRARLRRHGLEGHRDAGSSGSTRAPSSC